MKIKQIIIFAMLLSLAACTGQPEPTSSSAAAVSSAPIIASSVASSESSLPASSVAPSSEPVSSSSLVASSSSAPVSSSSQSSAVEQVTGSLVLAINAGATAKATFKGVEYGPDKFPNGGTANTTADSIAGVDEDSLFQSERYGMTSYDIPVTNATYSVVLHFVEMYQDNPGLRSFNVSVEGKDVVSNLDLYSTVGHDTAYSVVYNNFKVSDGSLSINFKSNVENPTISGFAIYSTDGGQYEEPAVQPICPTSGPCKILPLGDSITDGIGVDGGGGYRIELFKKAVEAGKNITFVGSKLNGPTTVAGKTFPRNHEGYSGWTIEELSAQIPSPALNGNPHIILLHIGTNNFWKTENEINQSPAKLGSLIDKIFNAKPDVLLVVSSVIPYFGRETSYNQAIPGVVRQRADMGFNIIFVDQFKAFPSGGLSGDSVHPNTNGYAAMGRTWYGAIEQYLH